jgi:hypothetical protein
MKPLALILTLTSGFSLYAADNSWIPVTGVVVDPVNHSLRPIQGLPGASQLGPALNVPFAVNQAAILGQNAALAIDAPGDPDIAAQAWRVTGLLRGDLNASPINGVIAGVDRIATNGSGSVAVLYSKSNSRLQFVSGLPDSASVSDPISIPGSMGAIAVSDDGGWALIGVTDSGVGAVYRVGPATNNQLLPVTTLGDPSAIILKGTQDAVIADHATNEVFLVQDVAGAQQRTPLVDRTSGVSGPSALLILPDQSILIANAGSQTVGRLDPATSQMSTIPIIGVPDRFEKILQPGLYALNQPGGAPLLLLDASSDLNVVFVPQER